MCVVILMLLSVSEARQLFHSLVAMPVYKKREEESLNSAQLPHEKEPNSFRRNLVVTIIVQPPQLDKHYSRSSNTTEGRDD